GAVFGKDGVVQNYQVHLKEATETFTPSNSDGLDLKHTVTQTIHYVYSNGKQAAPDATASITFNRTATKDEVTGQSHIRHGQLQAQTMISQQLNHQRSLAILQVQRLQQRLIM